MHPGSSAAVTVLGPGQSPVPPVSPGEGGETGGVGAQGRVGPKWPQADLVRRYSELYLYAGACIMHTWREKTNSVADTGEHSIDTLFPEKCFTVTLRPSQGTFWQTVLVVQRNDMKSRNGVSAPAHVPPLACPSCNLVAPQTQDTPLGLAPGRGWG